MPELTESDHRTIKNPPGPRPAPGQRHHWTPQEEEFLRETYCPGDPACRAQIAAHLGVAPGAVKAKADYMGLITGMRRNDNYTAEDVAKLRDLVGKQNPGQVARILGRSRRSVRVKAAKLGLSWRDRDGWYTASEAAEILGVTSQWITTRIRNGALKATPYSGGPHCPKGGMWRISEKALRSFIRRHPSELTGRNIDVVRIVDLLAGLEIDRDYEKGGSQKETSEEK